MSGRPLLRQMDTRISEKEGGEDWIFEQFADGVTIAEVAKDLGCSRRYMYYWRDVIEHRERRREKWAEAMRISADVEVEKAAEDFERLDRVIGLDPDTGEPMRRIPNAAEITLVTGRAKFRQWRAAKKDPDKYGDQTNQVNINVNMGEQHLGTLKDAKRIRPRDPSELPVVEEPKHLEPGEDYEAVEE